ncbi:MAG: hypothetical protein JNJ64_07905 [Flavobacteriales bacterium]|nr:hypothetical protein [Flavobacteriales bacterium]
MRRTAWKVTWRFISSYVFGSITTAAFLATFGHNYIEIGGRKLTWPESLLAGAALLAGIAAVRFIYACFRVYMEERNRLAFDNVYGDAILDLNEAFGMIHATRRNEMSTDQGLIDSLTHLCEQLATLFSRKIGQKCSVCVKVGRDGSNLKPETFVKTLVRDPISKRKGSPRLAVDDPKHQHQILKNTAFSNYFTRLGTERARFWLCNDLPQEKGYESTSFDVVKSRAHEQGQTPAERDRLWPLKYKSEIVVPIRPLHQDLNEDAVIYGFLCVDSPATNKFNHTYDVGIMLGVADGVYDIIDRYRRSLQALNTTQPQSTT